MDSPAPDVLRMDRWLWFARFFKSRSAATQFCLDVRIRVNDAAAKPAHGLRVGDVLTFPLHSRLRVVRVVALGCRRGPAAEARLLYEDLSPPVEPKADAPLRIAPRAPGSGRPTKMERRALDRLRDR
jgi:ribosome-associated heat shock protein Hsp15